jgi:DNA-directed RNA polymerase subunit beta'
VSFLESKEIEALKIVLASSEEIRQWSHGEVTKGETYSYRTYAPEPDGLFCERIFGPVHSYQCHCGKLKGIQYKNLVCSTCGVEILPSSVRREKFGHIELASPIVHIWYFKNNINYIGLLLDIPAKEVEKVIYFDSYVVVDPKETKLRYKQILKDDEYRTYKSEGYNFVAKKGGEAIKDLLERVDLNKLKEHAIEKLKSGVKQEKIIAVRLLGVVEGLLANNRKSEDMVLTAVPVIPPDLRPLVPLEGGKYASDDLNELYRRVINRNNRLKKLFEVNAPDIMLQNEKRMLQEAVDALFDNGRRPYPVMSSTRKALRSLTDILKGKEGRFRENLLGKRVDYSGRAVIVVGPDLKIDQCGIPKEMALELFKPFVIYELSKLGFNKRRAKELVENPTPEVWKAVEDLSKNYAVLLNRAPTLHRLSIQAFKPILIEGKAIQISPLVCTPFNADFDGDQMAIHLPLSISAQTEARLLMLSSHNILSPAHSEPLDTPVQDMVLGSYYLTLENEESKIYKKLLDNTYEVELLYEKGIMGLHNRIRYLIDGEVVETTIGRVIFNSKIREGIFGEDEDDSQFRFINKVIDKKQLGAIVSDFYDRFGLVKTDILLDNLKEIGFNYSTYAGISIGLDDVKIPVKRNKIVTEGDNKTENINRNYEEGLLSEEDRYKKIVDVWQDIAKKVENAVFSNFEKFDPLYMMANSGARGSATQITQMSGMRGLMAGPTGKIIEFPIKSNLREGLSVLEYFLSTHGARKGQADTALKTADSGYLTRRLVDVAHEIIVKEDDCSVRTVYPTTIGEDIIESLSQKVIGKVSAEDVEDPNSKAIFIHSGDTISAEQAELLNKFAIKSIKIEDHIDGILISSITEGGATDKPVLSLSEQIWGRYAAEDVFEPQEIASMKLSKKLVKKVLAENIIKKDTGEVLASKGDSVDSKLLTILKKHDIDKVEIYKGELNLIIKRNQLIDKELAAKIESLGIKKIKVRSPITCKTDHGVCVKCYGLDLSSRKEVKVGESVGVIAAESIGEPGTQLTLRTFHTGGIAAEDITQGLPRVEELFSARSPKGKAIISSLSGKVDVSIDKVKQTINITNSRGEKVKLIAPRDKKLRVKTGDSVRVGDILSDGSLDPRELLEIKGRNFAARYLVEEIEKVYKSQGVDINVKHIEVIIKRMFDKVQVKHPGDTQFYEGEVVNKDDALTVNRLTRLDGGKIATFRPIINGITKTALSSDSFLSAASFQETPRVLAEAAIKGKVDLLRGMKESIIVGKKIPAGTNMNFKR